MQKTSETFSFHHRGIGDLIQASKLTVPPHQRSYAWVEEQVTDLLQDLQSAIDNDEADYFLGTVVVTRGENNSFEISDGQQRLATVTILIARIRDHFILTKKEQKAAPIEMMYLQTPDIETDEMESKLSLNVNDNNYFMEQILARPADRGKVSEEDMHESNQRMYRAAQIIDEHFSTLLAPRRPDEHDAILARWVGFLRDKTTVIVVTAPDRINAYRIFETLNDRGLKASQADILKTFLYSKAGNRFDEAQTRWASMVNAIETFGDETDIITYIRHYWVTRSGPTKERELADKIRKEITGTTKALTLLTELDDSAQHYVSIFNPEHPRWNDYRNSAREHVNIIANSLKVKQIRPLLFAVCKHFDVAEAEKAFRLFVSWSVRFLIVGGRGGMLDYQYSLRAHEVGSGKIKTAKALAKAMEDYVPNDGAFEAAFSTARISRAFFARYVLRTLDLSKKGESEPEWKANEDEDVINLEHVMPRSPSKDWNVDKETASACENRIGNMVLLRAKKNQNLANSSFAVKKKAYKESTYQITSEVAGCNEWGLEEIRKRQVELAREATKAWPITV